MSHIALQRHPGSAPGDVELVLLPGWGFPAAAWAPWLPWIEHLGAVTCVDWPGFGAAGCWPPLPALLDELAARLPAGAVLVGWSLGGMLAAELAARRPGAWRGLITIASNARYVAAPDWPAAMPAAAFHSFRAGLAAEPAATWRRFLGAVAQGREGAREALRLLRAAQPLPANPGALDQGLELLAALDMGAALDGLDLPVEHWFGEDDGLVPAAACAAFAERWPGHGRVLFAGCGHTPHLVQPQRAAQRLGVFLEVLRLEALRLGTLRETLR